MGQISVAPSALNHRLTLQRPVQTADGQGGLDTDWWEVDVVWGAVRPTQASRSQRAQQMVETVTHEITVRFRDDVESGWRFLLANREFAIRAVFDPDESGRFLRCHCEEEGR